MLISHIVKAVEYFATYGLPKISLEDLPILLNYIDKITDIYISYFFN